MDPVNIPAKFEQGRP